MQPKHYSKIIVLVFCLIWVAASPAKCEDPCVDGTQASGSIYRICMPPDDLYNGKLVIWAHGFQDAGPGVEIPEDQLSFGGISIPEIIMSLGYGFATNSYSKKGLAVVQGTADIVDLVSIFESLHGTPDKVFLTGASEGGLITALLTESHPELFDAGLAACGPVGDFPYQIKYFGDARATFQYFFRGLIPGDPFEPSIEFINNWSEYYESVVRPVVFALKNRRKLDQWVKVANLPYDLTDKYGSLEITVRDVLRYAVVNINDAAATLGGFPFENRWTWYRGSKNDFLLNLFVPRVGADPAAVAEMKMNYNTTGQLSIPLLTIHTLYDQQVPYFHEFLYNLKTISQGSFWTEHVNFPINRFGHCNFTPDEALLGFGLMLLYAGEMDTLEGVGSMLRGEELSSFESLAERFGLPYSVGGNKLRLK
jgi:pimeloyl-ACP methyl ester carboxylesterase